jgi:RNA polymerase sigma-70 factor, ECF subfamily
MCFRTFRNWRKSRPAAADIINLVGRRDDFDKLVLPQARNLLRLAVRLTSNSSHAEDLAQETLLRAWRGFGQFDPGTNAHAWVFRILMNVFLEQKRKEGSSALVDTPAHLGRPTQPSIQESVEVMQAFYRLGNDQRIVLLLAVVEGFTCREISGILDIPIGTVMSRLSRAREAMRELLSEVVR